jgi:hypothetical protein
MPDEANADEAKYWETYSAIRCSAGRCRSDQHTGFAYSANSCPIENLPRRHKLTTLQIRRQCIERVSDALGRKILREWRDVATAANERQPV